MPLIAKKSGTSLPLIDKGNHQAVCYGIVDLGTQSTEYKGVAKLKRQVLIMWEFPDLRIEMEKDKQKVSLPRVISKTYTLVLSDKASLLADLNSWRGVALTDKEKESFDIFTVLGANCLLQIIHVNGGEGKMYANIASIASLPKGMQKLKPENPIVRYSMEDDGLVIPDGLYDWVKDKIKKSAEYQAGESHQEDSHFPEEAMEGMTTDEILNTPASADDSQIPF